MTDKIRVTIPVVLDRPRLFSMDLQAVARWEVTTGKPFFSAKFWRHLAKNKKDTMIMFWACLAGDDPWLTPKALARTIGAMDEEKWQAVLSAIDSAATAFVNDFLIGGDKHGH